LTFPGESVKTAPIRWILMAVGVGQSALAELNAFVLFGWMQ
jgi:hypothetical protein